METGGRQAWALWTPKCSSPGTGGGIRGPGVHDRWSKTREAWRSHSAFEAQMAREGGLRWAWAPALLILIPLMTAGSLRLHFPFQRVSLSCMLFFLLCDCAMPWGHWTGRPGMFRAGLRRQGPLHQAPWLPRGPQHGESGGHAASLCAGPCVLLGPGGWGQCRPGNKASVLSVQEPRLLGDLHIPVQRRVALAPGLRAAWPGCRVTQPPLPPRGGLLLLPLALLLLGNCIFFAFQNCVGEVGTGFWSSHPVGWGGRSPCR